MTPRLFPLEEAREWLRFAEQDQAHPALEKTFHPDLQSHCYAGVVNRIVQAFRAFFALLFTGKLPDDMFDKPAPAPVQPMPPQVKPSDGALQLLGMLQTEARLLDFFMEDVAPYSDEQIAAAVRDIHERTRELLVRHFAPAPVIDAVEGSVANPSDANPALVKYVGNVPAAGKPPAGILRHRGWRATAVSLPRLNSRQDLAVLAPAEIEVE